MRKTPTAARILGCLLGQSVADAVAVCIRGVSSEEAARYVNKVVSTWFMQSQPVDLPEQLFITESSQLGWEITRLVAEQKAFDAALFSQRIVRQFDRRFVNERNLETHLAVKQLRAGKTWHESGVDSQACGSLPRAAAIGVSFWADDVVRRRAAEHHCQVTNSDPAVIAASVVITELVASLLCGECGPNSQSISLSVPEGNATLEREVAKLPALLTLSPDLALGEIAPQAASNGIQDDVFQGLLWALYCAVRHDWDYSAAVCCALTAGGELVAPASVVGALCGAAVGEQAIPESLCDIVSDRGVYRRADFERMAADCHRFSVSRHHNAKDPV